MMTSKIVRIDSVTPDPDTIHTAGKIIQDNGIVIFPAKCLYGIAANAMDKTAVERVFHLKQRPLNNPILVLVPDRTFLASLVRSIPEPAETLMADFWPGNLTLVFKARDALSDQLTAGTGKIGIRIPLHPVAKALVACVGAPVTGTSANLSGQDACNRVSGLAPEIIDPADLVLDAGVLKGGKGSTIVDVTGSAVQILREGEVTAAQIRTSLTI